MINNTFSIILNCFKWKDKDKGWDIMKTIKSCIGILILMFLFGPLRCEADVGSATANQIRSITYAANKSMSVPCRIHLTAMDTFVHIRSSSIIERDPIDHEDYATSKDFVNIMGHSELFTGTLIRIGAHSWINSSLLSPGWHERNVPLKLPFVRIQKLISYIRDVHQIEGRYVHGHPTIGYSFTLSQAGIRKLSLDVPPNPYLSSVMPSHAIKKISIKLWISSSTHLFELTKVTEKFYLLGFAFRVREKATYYDWGKGVHLSPPV